MKWFLKWYDKQDGIETLVLGTALGLVALFYIVCIVELVT